MADCSRDGGFPPLMLAPVDFVAMFQNQVSEKAGADNQTSQSPDKGNNKDQG